jgi:hypothetical protein
MHRFALRAALTLALVSAPAAAFADTVTASAVPTFTLTPSSDTLSFNALNTSVTVPGSFTHKQARTREKLRGASSKT